MLLGILVLGASLVLDWNEGVSYYEAGDVTNALRVLRPLMLTKEYGARAAEIVAKLENDKGDKEEAAAAAQIALRSHPNDERLKRNFARAAVNLEEYRNNAHIEEVLKSAAGKDPGELLRTSWYETKAVLEETGKLMENSAAEKIRISTDLSKRSEKLSDNWIPVRQAITQSVTNEQQAATILARLDEAKKATETAAVMLADLEAGDAYVKLGEVEDDFKGFLKMVAMPPLAIDEDYIAETNKNYQDALDFTRAFRAKFPAWAKEYQTQNESNTNQPPFTAEAQAKISALATELEQLQIDLKENERKIEIIKEIKELMPKGQGQGQGEAQGQAQGQDQGQGQAQGQDQGQGQDEGQDQDEVQGQGQGQGQDEEGDSSVEAVLQKAEERTKEHEEKKRRNENERRVRLSPNERDW